MIYSNQMPANKNGPSQREGKTSWSTSVPKVVYKFIDAVGGYQALQHRTIRFTFSPFLNDPQECLAKGLSKSDAQRIIAEVIAAKKNPQMWDSLYARCAYLQVLPHDLLEKVRKNPKRVLADIFEDFSKYIREVYFPNRKSRIAIASFSESKACQRMWSRYADHHKGIAIGYNTQCFRRLFPGTASFLRVQYTDEGVEIPVEVNNLWGVLERVVTTKTPPWSYEHEWRSVVLYEGKEMIRRKYLIAQLQPQDIVEINMGAYTGLDARKRLKNIANSFPNCNLFQADYNSTNLCMVFTLV